MVGNLLVALALFSGELDVQATAVVEARAGEQPAITNNNQEQAFVAAIVTPTGAVLYREPGLSLRLSYSPRIYWAYPNAIDDSVAPILLHTAGLVVAAQTTRRFALQGELSGSYGQPDYASLAQTFSGTVPQITKIASATGGITARTALTRRWELDLDGRLFYWKALKVPDGVPPLTITEQKSATEQATALFQLTHRHALGFGVAASQASYSSGIAVYTVGPTATWKARLTPVDELKVMLGLQYVRATEPTIAGVMPLLGPSGYTVSPIGGFELVSRVARRDEVLILANAAAGVTYYVDPVVQTAAPRAEVAAGLTGIMLPTWLATVRGDFATTLRTSTFYIGTTIPDETVASLTLSVQRLISPGFFMEIGGIWAERAPALVTPDFQFHQRQLWVFARLSWTNQPLPRQSIH
jgi:hypothetical protein